MRNSLVVVLLLLAAVASAMAKEAPPAADDPALERRTMAIAAELRCLVCQNQTIADSGAGLAIDLRNQIREQLRQGRTEQQILDYMVDRYGDFVLYRPPFKMATALLWLGPLLLILGGLWLLFHVLVRRRAEPAPESLSQAERDRARTLLENE
jgi:cytochrome c-type biogenesis protein CcmH